MAKRIDKWEAQHRRNVERYQRLIDDIYKEAVREAASLTPLLGNSSPGKPFSFADHPITRQRLKKLLDGLKNGVETSIVNGVRSEWTLANDKNDELCDRVFGDNADSLTDEQRKRYYSNNDKAREAFIARKTAGLNLSDRVWNYTGQFKEEIEMGIDLGLRDGLSADEMSRQLRQYLKYPDKLFRRVRDEHGILHLSKRAKAFHPGAGVYRSSYKNARRLAATETNIAYRTADHERYQQLDFVVGIRIELSNNHTLNGVPFYDICDELSAPLGSKATSGRGCYPKDFKFTGWHPLCRCTTFSILKTDEEIKADTQRILDRKPLDGKSVNRVDGVPQEFRDWVENNRERMARAKSLPYFLRDNDKYVSAIAIVQKQAKFDKVIEGLKNSGIARVPVRSVGKDNTLEAIVKRVGGGDMTSGSCASLCLAFVGNRCGYSVLDFRDGQSRITFSMRATWDKINDAVNGVKKVGKDDFAVTRELLGNMTEGKEYILITGGHAAIVRNTTNGLEHLELQTVSGNGYKKLDDNVLRHRFGAKTRKNNVLSSFLIEIDRFKEASDLRQLLSYINTAKAKQVKGKGGSAK